MIEFFKKHYKLILIESALCSIIAGIAIYFMDKNADKMILTLYCMAWFIGNIPFYTFWESIRPRKR